ncbi:MAG: hypothetical protein HYR48_08315 [Gemmatimonadetes bacterium]|nr:hypothetical protein [Gemmatimonadota bacterium]
MNCGRALLAAALLFVACAVGDGSRTGRTAETADTSAVAASPAPVPPVTGAADRVAAHGTEPFWAVSIDASGVVYRTPEDTAGVRFPPAGRRTAGDIVAYRSERATGEPRSIEVRLGPGACSNGMSEIRYPLTAEVHLMGDTLHGCAERR